MIEDQIRDGDDSMNDATFWLSVVSLMIPPNTSLIHATKARWLLDEAAVWQGERGFTGYCWKFPDASFLCADPERVWVRETVGS